MKFECADLDRALAVPELMPELVAHARECEECRRALRIWQSISAEAPGMHQEWESPELWPRIEEALKREPPRRVLRRRWVWYGVGALAAAMVLAAVLVPRQRTAQNDLLSERALQEVEQAEGTYVASIERLQKVAEPVLEKSGTPLAAVYEEKLSVLDAAISDLRVAVRNNPYNANLRLELASLYREKKKTLEESMKRETAN